jgi:hypothetical protein
MLLQPILLVLSAMTLLQTTTVSEAVVIEVTGKSALTVGRIIRSDQALDIPAGVELRLLAGPQYAERVIHLVGPYSGRLPLEPTPSGNPVLRRLSALMLDRQRLSPFRYRSAGAADGPDAQAIDISTGGHKCLVRTEAALLWMPALPVRSSILVNGGSDGAPFRIDWPAGTEQMPWPKALPIVSGSRYAVELPGHVEREITLHVAPETSQSGADLAAWMLESGCSAQAARVLASLPERVVSRHQ